MRFVLSLLLAALTGLAAGAASALWMGGLIPGGPWLGNAVAVDGWRSDWSIGTEAADPYVRARIARHGLLALRKEEAVYFIRSVDEDGRALSEACTYRVSGGAFPAEWWSITLYDAGSRLPMNTDAALSFDATDAGELDASAGWAFTVAPERGGRPEQQWVSSRAAGTFDLMLRLYLPSQALLADPEATLRAPAVDRISCEGGA